MENSKLSDVLTDVFGGVNKMLTQKKFPQNLRAIRMLAEELLRGVFGRSSPKSYTELINVVEDLFTRSTTLKL
ncbi:hypothetical protein HOLleu_27142 [Holothuria leucospilota]|uniref:Uncharacterized protein n=1 Tax=Holothuria leucospilota TaxID=206669 RepID=A0A9Q1BQ04_HOLLE|nr:hypothetical protein HOLleu_27142 [Holothuria leucospilota]